MPLRYRFLSGLNRFRAELLIALSITLLGFVYMVFPELRTSLQCIYFVPIVASAMLLGWKQASAFTVVGVSLVMCVTGVNWTDHSIEEFIHLVLWGCTLGTTSAVIGLIVSAREKQVSLILEKQSSLALTDELTQVPNRRAFDMELRRRMSEFQRYQRILSILMIDIDYFKKFNDRFGHAVGDRVLQIIAQTIGKCLREADMVARFGGEEFSVLLPDTHVDEAHVVAERIRQAVDQIDVNEIDCPQKVTISIGVTEIQPDDDEATLLERGDFAMYAAKRNGRNQVFLNRGDGGESESQIKRRDSAQQVYSIYSEAHAVQNDGDAIMGLTQLRVFDDELNRRIYEAARYNMNLCIGLVEMEFLGDAETNRSDICHQIRLIGQTMRDSLRESDVITWYSEFEFGVLLPFTKLEDGSEVLKRLFHEINLDLVSSVADPIFKVHQIRIVHRQEGETRKQVLKRLRNVQPLDELEIGEGQKRVFDLNH